LRRDELNGVDDLDPYLQGQWQPTQAWTLVAGVRRSTVHFRSTDQYVMGTNPDDSGASTDTATLPVAAVLYAISPALHAYATAGRGFETPTLNEIAYRPNGETGLNFDLRPSHSDNAEVGLKGRAGAWGEWRAAVFDIRTKDEIVTLSNVGGRSTYQNVGATKRQGVELSWQARPLPDWQLQAAYTFLDATYDTSFLTCTSTPCQAPNVTVPSGSHLPGVARHALNAMADWSPFDGLHAGLEGRYLSAVPVNDINSDYAPGFFVADVHAGWTKTLGAWTLTATARIDDIADKKYIGSVIVNEGNGRYFEPAPGRTWFAGLSATAAF
jgi:iron complex outermembrane receptor protein